MILGCCCGGCDPAPSPVPEFENVTRVTDYSLTPAAGGIAPYARPWRYCDTGSCLLELSAGGCGVAGQPVCFDNGFDGLQPANLWQVTGIKDCTAEGAGMVSQIADNCYRATGGTVSFPSHCSYGWKGVQSKAVWPGLHGFVNSGGPCCPTGGQQQSKYTSIKIIETAEIHETSTTYGGARSCLGGADETYERYYYTRCEQTAVVDSFGNVRRTGSVAITAWIKQDGIEDAGGIHDSCYLGDITAPQTATLFGQSISGAIIPQPVAPFWAECGVITFTVDGVSYTGTATELNALDLFPPDAEVTQGSCPSIGTNTASTVNDPTSHAAVFSCTDDTIEVDYETITTGTYDKCCDGGYDVADAEGTTRIHYNQKIVLSGGIAYGDVIDDAESLLDEWPLNDDSVYGWRTDAQTWLMPLVKRDAGSVAPTIAWGTDSECQFANDILYSGDIIGAPLPHLGYARHFNFKHINWLACMGIVCNACEESLGAFSASPLPATATSWTDKFDGASQYGPGAHLSGYIEYQYGDSLVNTNEVWAQKWAETLEEWPSVNHSRPCARDRYLYDEAAVACIIDFTWPALEIDTLPAVEFAVNDVVVLNDGGVYTIATKTDAQNYTVGAKIYDSPLTCDGASKLRYPSARAICSSITATAVQTSPGLITVTTTDKHWLRGGGTSKDTITFTGIGGLTTAEATYVDDYNFTVAGTLTSDPDSGTISHGATTAEAAFDTTCPRHDFIYSEWQSNHREMAEDPMVDEAAPTETQHTIAPIRRHPTVLCISPNSRDSFPHGLTVGFGSIEADQCYGEEWHAKFNQAEADPFWQATHVPCGHGSTWTQAEQPCTTGANEYDYPPLVEPRLVAPSGAPTIPVTLHDVPYMPNPVSHPSCDIEPYASPTPHFVRAEWLLCDDWREIINDNC